MPPWRSPWRSCCLPPLRGRGVAGRRRWGVAVAGILGGLPVVAGPILVVLTLVHGGEFGAEAAAGTLLGLAALTLFVVVYGRAAERAGPVPSLLAGWAGVPPRRRLPAADRGRPASRWSSSPPASRAASRRCRRPAPCRRRCRGSPAGSPRASPRIAGPGLALTAASGALGPNLSGLLAPFQQYVVEPSKPPAGQGHVLPFEDRRFCNRSVRLPSCPWAGEAMLLAREIKRVLTPGGRLLHHRNNPWRSGHASN